MIKTENGAVFPLDTGSGEQREIRLVTGPLPYLWIGADDGDFYGCTVTTEQLRLLRDSITAALRHAYR